MLKFLLQFITVASLSGCCLSGKMQGTKYDQYYNHFNKITGYSGCDLYKFDSTGYSNFIYKEDFSTLVSIVYGYFLNDTLKIQPELIKDTNPNCKTVVFNEVKRKLEAALSNEIPVTNDFIFTSHLINMKTNATYENNTHRKKLVVTYNQVADKIFRKYYPGLSKICMDNNFELIVLTLDPVW